MKALGVVLALFFALSCFRMYNTCEPLSIVSTIAYVSENFSFDLSNTTKKLEDLQDSWEIAKLSAKSAFADDLQNFKELVNSKNPLTFIVNLLKAIYEFISNFLIDLVRSFLGGLSLILNALILIGSFLYDLIKGGLSLLKMISYLVTGVA